MFDKDRYSELLTKVPDLGLQDLIDIRHAIKNYLATVPDDGPRQMLTDADHAGMWLQDNVYYWDSNQIQNPDLTRTDTEQEELSLLQRRFALAVAAAEKATGQMFVPTA